MYAESLQPVEVVEGSPAKLQCKVTGVPEPSIEWLRDSEPVKEDKYDAENDLGSVSCASELLVNEPNKKPEFIEKMKPVNVTEGEPARFDATVEGNPLQVVDWFKGKDKLDDEGRYVMMDDEEAGNSTLIVKDTVPEDAGTYKCVAADKEGQARSKAALAVKEKMISPEFTDEEASASINVTDGDEDSGVSKCDAKSKMGTVTRTNDVKVQGMHF